MRFHVEHFYNLINSSLSEAKKVNHTSIKKLVEYGKLIHSGNSKYNLTGHKTLEEIINKLIIESIVPVNLSDVPRGTSAADMGTGAGIPGIPLAILYPEIQFTLFDSNNKKTGFIHYVANKLHIDNIIPVCGRIEDLSREKEYREIFSIVVSRAMSDVYTAGELCSPYLEPGGYIYLYISEKQRQLPFQVVDHLKKLSLDIIAEGISSSPFNIKTTSGLLLYKTSSVADIYPRRISAIRRGSAESEKFLK